MTTKSKIEAECNTGKYEIAQGQVPESNVVFLKENGEIVGVTFVRDIVEEMKDD